MAITPHFNTVYFEISSACNGKCPYCITGRNKSTVKPTFVDLDLFTAACHRMVKLGILSERSLLHLYLWGEPTLHPHFSELLQRIENLPFGVAISTNASKVPNISSSFVKKVHFVRFSCCGTSQNSYSHIHGFDVTKVHQNIVDFVKTARAKGSKAFFSYNFHIYQFNIDEIPYAKEFCKQLDIEFSPNLAIINDWDLTKRWVANALTVEEERCIGQDLFNYMPAKLLKNAPANYHCPQEQYLILNELGNILICCQTPSTEAYSLGHILDPNVAEHIANRQKGEICKHCTSTGMAYMFNNSLYCPSIFK